MPTSVEESLRTGRFNIRLVFLPLFVPRLYHYLWNLHRSVLRQFRNYHRDDTGNRIIRIVGQSMPQAMTFLTTFIVTSLMVSVQGLVGHDYTYPCTSLDRRRGEVPPKPVKCRPESGSNLQDADSSLESLLHNIQWMQCVCGIAP